MSALEEIPLAQPVLGVEEEERVLEVLRSGQLSLGPRVPAFEEAFAGFVGAPLGSAVSSGTAGLHLGLRAAGVTDGDEVVTSPFSFVASANVIAFERATPVFADIDPRTLNLDPQAAAAAVTERTTALLPVHIFGYPADIPAFERMGLPIVEDACEALGARHADGVAVGARGHAASFGFYANKQLTTGEGGMVLTSDPAVKARIDSERNQGRAPDMGWLDHDRLGFNYRMTDLQAATAAPLTDLRDAAAGALARQLSPRYLEEHCLLPLGFDADGMLLLAVSAEPDPTVLDELQRFYQRPVRVVLHAVGEIRAALLTAERDAAPADIDAIAQDAGDEQPLDTWQASRSRTNCACAIASMACCAR